MWSIQVAHDDGPSREGRGDARSRRAWDLAARQHGVIGREQLLALGFSPRAIDHRLARGRLYSLMRGVYAVGRPQVTREGRWMAAVLACGNGALLSHTSAAALWQIGRERLGRIDISVRRRCDLRRPGLKVRSRPSIREEDAVARIGIPVTSPVQTLIDLACELGTLTLERAVNEACSRDLVDPESLRRRLDDHARERGVPRLRELLDRYTFRLSDSDLEVYFRPIAAAAGLPPPLTQLFLNGYRVDFYWPDLKLVVETDSLRFHRTPSRQARDARRDRAHIQAGMTPLRFTHYEVRYEPARVQAELAATVAVLERRDLD